MNAHIMNFDSTFRSALSSHHTAPTQKDVTRAQVALVVAGGTFTGALMGSFALWNGGGVLFALWGALKVPLLLGLSGALCFPILRVLSFLLGIGEGFQTATRALLGVSATFACVLAALSPLTLLVYASGASYRGALGWNIGVWIFAALVAGVRARTELAPQLKREKRLRVLGAWGFALWAFVAVQAGWSLRPFIGRPDAPPQFLRRDALSNAYVGLGKLMGARG
jgi:hypothetical protein